MIKTRLLSIAQKWGLAHDSASRILHKNPNNRHAIKFRAIALAHMGDKTQAEDLLSDYLMQIEKSGSSGSLFYHIAELYVSLGQYDQAIKYLNMAWNNGHIFTIYRYHLDPTFLPLKSESNYHTVIQKL